MAGILVRGGDTDTATREMRAAVHEIFGVDPSQATRGLGGAPGTRTGGLAAMIALGLPPAIVAAKELAPRGWEADLRLGAEIKTYARKLRR